MQFRQYREKSAVSAAAEFMPVTALPVVVPAGTQIQAVLKDSFTTSTKPGDSIRAFVTDPVMVNDTVAIPEGARLDGIIEAITAGKSQATAWLNFRSLLMGDKSMHIET